MSLLLIIFACCTGSLVAALVGLIGARRKKKNIWGRDGIVPPSPIFKHAWGQKGKKVPLGLHISKKNRTFAPEICESHRKMT